MSWVTVIIFCDSTLKHCVSPHCCQQTHIVILCVRNIAEKYVSKLTLVFSAPNYEHVISSWEEQKNFSYVALEALKDHPLADDVKTEWAKLEPKLPDLTSQFSTVQFPFLFIGLTNK